MPNRKSSNTDRNQLEDERHILSLPGVKVCKSVAASMDVSGPNPVSESTVDTVIHFVAPHYPQRNKLASLKATLV